MHRYHAIITQAHPLRIYLRSVRARSFHASCPRACGLAVVVLYCVHRTTTRPRRLGFGRGIQIFQREGDDGAFITCSTAVAMLLILQVVYTRKPLCNTTKSSTTLHCKYRVVHPFTCQPRVCVTATMICWHRSAQESIRSPSSSITPHFLSTPCILFLGAYCIIFGVAQIWCTYSSTGE